MSERGVAYAAGKGASIVFLLVALYSAAPVLQLVINIRLYLQSDLPFLFAGSVLPLLLLLGSGLWLWIHPEKMFGDSDVQQESWSPQAVLRTIIASAGVVGAMGFLYRPLSFVFAGMNTPGVSLEVLIVSAVPVAAACLLVIYAGRLADFILLE